MAGLIAIHVSLVQQYVTSLRLKRKFHWDVGKVLFKEVQTTPWPSIKDPSSLLTSRVAQHRVLLLFVGAMSNPKIGKWMAFGGAPEPLKAVLKGLSVLVAECQAKPLPTKRKTEGRHPLGGEFYGEGPERALVRTERIKPEPAPFWPIRVPRLGSSKL